jgi:hypothetical protein
VSCSLPSGPYKHVSNLTSSLHFTFCPAVEETDQEALSFLTDLNVTYEEDDYRNYTITMTFAENPYFKDTELKKVYKVSEAIKKEMPYELNAPVETEAVTIS